jgi:hypothetical protein
MTHKSKPDWCVFAGIALAAAALFLHVEGWIAGPVLLILLLCAYPQSYELAAEELVIHDSLTRRRIPYHEIRGVRAEERGVRIRYGLGADVVIAPADAQSFVDAIAARTPRDRYVEYTFPRARGAYRTN